MRTRLFRLLLDPNAPASGGGTPPPAPVPPPNPVFQAPPTGAPGGPPIPQTIPLTVDEYQRLRNVEREYQQSQAARQQELEAKERERIDALAAKGKAEEALDLTRKAWEAKYQEQVTKATEFQQGVFRRELENALRSAIVGRRIIGETTEIQVARANMIVEALKPDFEVVTLPGGGTETRERATGRPAAQVLKERLDSPLYGNFFEPEGKGGAGTGGTRPPAAPPTPPPVHPTAAAMLDYINRNRGVTSGR